MTADRTDCRCCGAELPSVAALSGVDRLAGVAGRFEVRICTSCGSGTTFPIVEDSGLAAFYGEEYNPHGGWQPPRGILTMLSRRIRKFISNRALASQPLVALRGRTGRVLDVGCGRGDLGALLIAQGWDATGLEPSPDACEIARGQGVEAINGTLTEVDLAGRAFEAITYQHSLEHVNDPARDLEIAAGLLSAEGLLLVSVPNFGCAQRKIFGGRWFHLDLPRHRFHYTADGLKALADRAGLEVQSITTSSTPVGLPGSLMYATFGRWLFRGPVTTRLYTLGSLALYPLVLLIDKFGGGDALHMVAVKPA